MKITIKITLFAVCIALLLAGCDVKDPIYNTPHPDKGAIVVSADWSHREENAAIPTKYIVEVAGAKVALQKQKDALPGVFAPGEAVLLGYNIPEGVTIDNGVGTMKPDSGILFSGTATATVVADDTTQVTIAMLQRMREVVFTLTVREGDPERITSAVFRLSGVSLSVNLATGEVTGPVTNVSVPLVRTGNKLEAFFHIAGILPDVRQELSVDLTFSDQIEKTESWDATEILKNFNADMLTPARVNAEMDVPLRVDMGGSIIDWDVDHSDDVDANM